MEKVAILGMGRWGKTWHRVLADMADVEVVAVAARSNASQYRAGEAVAVFEDFERLIASGMATAAIITLPASEHLRALDACARYGVAALCEKPLVETAEEIRTVKAIATTARRPLRVNQNYRLREWVQLAAQWMPRIGALQSVEVTFAQPEFIGGNRERMRHPLIADMAIHHLDLMRHLTGREVRVVSATSDRPERSSYLGDTDVDAELKLVSPAHNPVTARYRATWAARGHVTPWDGDWTFVGSDGTLTVRRLSVEVEQTRWGAQQQQTSPPVADEDLAQAWVEFTSAISGREDAGITIDDNSASVEAVLALARACGREFPHEEVRGA